MRCPPNRCTPQIESGAGFRRKNALRCGSFLGAGMSPTIRPVTRADYNQWLPLWDGYNAFYKRTGPTAVPPEVTQTTWARFFDGYEPVHALIAESDGKLVGLVHYIFHRNTTML